MSEFHVRVVRVGDVRKNPNADRLWVTKVPGMDYTVQFATDDYKPGDLAVYVPFDAVVPCDDPRWSYLEGKTNPVMDPPGYRIRAMKLKGVFSTGVYTTPLPGMQEGDEVADVLRIRRYEPEIPEPGSADDIDPGFIPLYTDIEGLRAFPDLIAEDEEVVLTEKIHGESARFVYRDGRIWFGSRTRIKKREADTRWGRVVKALGLEERLRDQAPNIIIYGEVCGYTKGFLYGKNQGEKLFVFDAFNIAEGKYLDYDETEALAARLNLPMTPVLYRGPWRASLTTELSDGPSTIADASHIREGFVMRPVKERYDDRLGRVILKMHGETFLLKH